jgi:hypothetical protein
MREAHQLLTRGHSHSDAARCPRGAHSPVNSRNIHAQSSADILAAQWNPANTMTKVGRLKRVSQVTGQRSGWPGWRVPAHAPTLRSTLRPTPDRLKDVARRGWGAHLGSGSQKSSARTRAASGSSSQVRS